VSARALVARWGLVSSAAAPVLLVGGWTWAARLQAGGFDQVRQTISALAGHGAEDRWVMSAALVGVGCCHVLTALALRPAATTGRVLLAVGGLATLAVAAQPLPVTGSAPGHAVAAVVAFGALSVWPAAAVVPGSPSRSPLAPRVGWLATAVLGGLTCWFFGSAVGDSSSVGLVERLAAGSQAVWPFVATVALVVGEGSRRGTISARGDSAHEMEDR
jgi:hypothetical membrane protein